MPEKSTGKKIGFLPPDAPSVMAKKQGRQTMVLPTLDENTGIRVDFIFSFTPYETGAIKRAKKIIIMDQEVNFASPKDVIIHKIFAGRSRDIEDVKTIILKNVGIDIQYMRCWLKEFDTPSNKKGFLKTFEKILRGLSNTK